MWPRLVLLIATVPFSLPAQKQYLRLDTMRVATMRRELSEAAAQGYRVVAGIGCCDLVLERVATPPAVYEYLYLDKADGLARFQSQEARAAVEKQLNEAGVRGFRVVPQVIAILYVNTYEQAILMEKAPGPAQGWEYRFGLPSANPPPGYRSVRMLWVGGFSLGKRVLDSPHGTQQILERPVGAQPGAASPAYQLLEGEQIFALESSLRKLSAEGYRVVESADSEMKLLLEKSTDPFEYSVIGGQTTAAMEQGLNKAGSEGYRLMPRAVGTYDKPKEGRSFMLVGVQVEVFAVLEKPLPSKTRFAYLLATGPEQLAEASRQGYEAVSMMDFSGSSKRGVVILEKAIAPANEGVTP